MQEWRALTSTCLVVWCRYLSGVPTPTAASPGGMWILDLEGAPCVAFMPESVLNPPAMLWILLIVPVSTHIVVVTLPFLPRQLVATANPVWHNTEAFYGKPFILCTLLDFGGQQGLFGNMGAVESSVQQALNASAAKSASPVGVGITMEGIWQVFPVNA